MTNSLVDLISNKTSVSKLRIQYFLIEKEVNGFFSIKYGLLRRPDSWVTNVHSSDSGV